MPRDAFSKPVRTFTIGFEDRRYDETRFAAAVAKHLGTEHHEFVVRPNAAEDLPKLAAVFGEPLGDSSALPTHYLSRETRQFVKVALSGDGGDELFGGYDRYRAVQIAGHLDAMATTVDALRPLWMRIPGSHPKSRGARITRLLGSVGMPPGKRYLSYLELFNTRQIDELLSNHGDRATPLRGSSFCSCTIRSHKPPTTCARLWRSIVAIICLAICS